MDKSKALPDTTDVPKHEAAEKSPTDAPLFDRYTVKVDVTISAGAVPTGHPPIGY